MTANTNQDTSPLFGDLLNELLQAHDCTPDQLAYKLCRSFEAAPPIPEDLPQWQARVSNWLCNKTLPTWLSLIHI